MNIFLFLLSTVAICFCLQSMDGPFEVLNKFRNLVVKIPFLGPVFFKVINCNFCLGFWVTILLSIMVRINHVNLEAIKDLIMTGFAGAAVNMIFNKIIGNSEYNSNDQDDYSVTVKVPTL